MANNYLQFSAIIPQLTPEEEAWLRAQLQTVVVHHGQETEIDGTDETDAADAEWLGPRFLRDKEDYDPSWGGTDFQYEFDDDTYSGWGRHLWVYAEESGEPSDVAWLVRKFLKQFRRDQCWPLTWATTCSKMRVGEFSGGAVFVTAEQIKYQSGYGFIRQEQAAFEAQKPSSNRQGTSEDQKEEGK
jgi:hypothetical protein